MSEPFVFVDVPASSLPAAHAKDACRECGCPYGYLGRYIKADASVSIRWVCENCGKSNTTGDLPYDLTGAVPLDRLPLAQDHSHEGELPPDCPRCGMPAREYHHWAPRAIFPDWPDIGVYLCTHCHREWHARMRQHGLRWPHEMAA